MQAVDYSSQHLLLNALDARAATYEKLGDLQPALRDAKKMIDTMPKLSKVCSISST
jgi:F-box/TPR repeat protein Pof3